MLEYEKKVLLNEHEHRCILNSGYDFDEQQMHINHYYDTDSFGYNELGISCRIREKKGVYVATVKQHGRKEMANEKSIYVKNENDDSLFDGMSVKYFGLMKTWRREATPLKGVTVVLDRNQYFDIVDYELEIEYEVGYEKVAVCVLEDIADNLFYNGLTEYRTEFISRANTAPNKSQRFFRRLSELKFDSIPVSCKEYVHEFGDFAHGYIDVRSGNFKLALEGGELKGGEIPFNIKYVYDGEWKLNLMQCAVAKKITCDSVQYDGYTITDANGEKSYFIPAPGIGLNSEKSEKYVDRNDKNRTYDAAENKLHTDGKTYLFNRSGKIFRISDDEKNCLDVTYIGKRITGVSDSNGNELVLDYNLRSQLKAITTSDTGKVVYSYDSPSGMLSSVVYPQGNRIYLKYTDNKISSIELANADGSGIYKVEYSYDENKVVKAEEFFFDENGEYRIGVISNYIYMKDEERTVVYIAEISYFDTKEKTSTISKSIFNFSKEGKVISCYVYPCGSMRCTE